MKDVRTLSITTDVIYHRWPAKSERLLSSFCLLHRDSTQALPNFGPRSSPQLHADLQTTDSWGSEKRQVLILSPYLPSPLLRVVPSLLCPKLLSGTTWRYRIHSIRCILSSLSTQKLLAVQTWCPSISWDGWPLQGAQRSCASEPWQKKKGKTHNQVLSLHFNFLNLKVSWELIWSRRWLVAFLWLLITFLLLHFWWQYHQLKTDIRCVILSILWLFYLNFIWGEQF